MTKKVFISYSHKDEAFRETLDEHLSILKMNGVIDAWHDRKIIPGQKWGEEISSNLESAEIIIFLISSSFLASGYCMAIEARRAIEMSKEGKARLIPIVVRACSWSGHELAGFQGLPKDALAVSSWSNQDEAWLDVVNGLENHINLFKPTEVESRQVMNNCSPSVKDSVYEWIDDTEVVLTHRKVSKVKLSDIYVDVDLEGDLGNSATDIEVISSKRVFENTDFYLISGEEQQGKTSFLKQAYKNLIQSGCVAIYLDAKEIKKSNIDVLLESVLKDQYDNLTVSGLDEISKKTLLIDNLDELGINSKFRAKLLNDINSKFNHVIVTCDLPFTFVVGEIPELGDYRRHEMLGLGHRRRAEIVEKWVSLGIEECIGETELYHKSDELKGRLDSIIRKNIVPSKPIYVLMLLQMFEAYAQQNLDLTSHGHCYQQLVYKAFDNAGIPQGEVAKYLNVLTEISWKIYKNNGNLNREQLDSFFTEYGKVYLPVNQQVVMSKLQNSSVLTTIGYKAGFKYQYLFYFFVAKKIAESFGTDHEVQAEVDVLVNHLHREDYSNILVFVTHHTKDSWVLDKIESVFSELFKDDAPADLSRNQLSFMDEFVAQIPELIIEQREIREERDQRNQLLDEAEREDDLESDQDLAPLDILANINKTFKGMDIAGQIIRNRHATLTRDALYELASNGALAGLRFLNYFINISDVSKGEIIRFIEQKLREHPNLTNQDIQTYAQNAYLHLTYGVISGVVRKIASSIGSKEALVIYEQIEETEKTPALTLVKQAIGLNFSRTLDVEGVEETARKLKDNPVCTRILKEMVIQHIYMFPIGYKEKQQIAELLNISVKGQRLMDIKKAGK